MNSQSSDERLNRSSLAENIVEAARDYRLAEPLSERDPEQLLLARRELDLLLAKWEV